MAHWGMSIFEIRQVEETADCTYFCVVGWGPGGYSGIQQLEGGRRAAIFSMWDGQGQRCKVECQEAGEQVHVSDFGGEGTGKKATKSLNWKVGDTVTFKVSAIFYIYTQPGNFRNML